MKQSKLQRIVLLTILAYESIGGLLGGILLILGPDGHYMDMSVEIMHGTFPDFLIPGIILTGMGALTTVAFVAVFFRSRLDWLLATFAMGGFIIWFATEITILRQLHWLHIMWGVPVLIGSLIVVQTIPWATIRKVGLVN
ncbi:MAG TPA: hypothetical protein VG917_02270 [Patescibacteria group bacterium]|nr:hypothetical protein [Patescibacteria group bacterium]